MKIYKSKNCYITIEKSSIPWIVIFTNRHYKEFSEVPYDIKLEILNLLDIIEKKMINYYNPTKINIASFGNYLPRVHFHIMARFEEDSYFPEPMWGKKQREANLKLPSFAIFIDELIQMLEGI